MNSNIKNIGVILAGGSGLRLGNDLPKQFLVVKGKTVLAHTLSTFNNIDAIDEIIIVIHKDFIAKAQEIVETEKITKVKYIVPGGKERFHSTLAALETYKDSDCNLIIHDAVRLLVSERIINNVIESLKEYKASTTAIKATDTILISDPYNIKIDSIPDRNRMYQVQTPQGFNMKILQTAYSLAMEDPDFKATDDCGVLKKYLPQIPIKIVEGETTNIKLTYKEDISLIENILKKNKY